MNNSVYYKSLEDAEMAKIINLTPHVATLFVDGIIGLEIPASGSVARCKESSEQIDSLNIEGVKNFPIVKKVYGEVEGLPEEQPGIFYFCSALVGQAIKGTRNDVLVPGDAVRDAANRIIGCSSFSKI